MTIYNYALLEKSQFSIFDCRSKIKFSTTDMFPNFAGLKDRAEAFIRQSVTTGTMSSYKRFKDRYTSFWKSHKLAPYSSESMESWVVQLAEDGRSHGSILSHVSAIKFFCSMEGRKVKFATSRLKLILRGIKNSGPINTTCAVITLEQLVQMVKWAKVLGAKKAKRFSAMVTCAFFGFLRPSEYCVTGSGHEVLARNAHVSSSYVDLKFNSFKHSKSPANIRIEAQGGPSCPVHRLKRYIKVLKKSRGPLFPIKYKEFVTEFNQVVEAVGVGCKVSPHALRRGGASWASLQGWSDSRIRSFGRWSSNAFKKYIVLK